jgi:hypothetical protein
MTFVRLSDSGFYQREIFWFLLVAFLLHTFIQLLDHQIDKNTPFTRHAFSPLHRHRPWLSHLLLIAFLIFTGWQSVIAVAALFTLFTFALWGPTKQVARRMSSARQRQLSASR